MDVPPRTSSRESLRAGGTDRVAWPEVGRRARGEGRDVVARYWSAGNRAGPARGGIPPRRPKVWQVWGRAGGSADPPGEPSQERRERDASAPLQRPQLVLSHPLEVPVDQQCG